ncbi:helix-turn-helix transcriptional regulator [Sulfitobacter faviae]|uniref:helix-turn-helix transcriptional regulator n=1 Tax=Sulfitobacter faviae TaxID=1775881 RepID=UPI00398D645F
MSDTNTSLPKWLSGRRYCTIKDLMRLFEVSRATIDRWHRENPDFPRKHKFGNPFNENCSTRFVVPEVNAYVAMVEGDRAEWTKQFDPVDSDTKQRASDDTETPKSPPM